MSKRETQVKNKHKDKKYNRTHKERSEKAPRLSATSDLMPSYVPSAPTAALPELLAPCGTTDSVNAAIEGGADAIYLGGKQFNARINANNFDNASLYEAIKLCHIHGVKAYITVNTLIYDREMPNAAAYAAFIRNSGADGIIIADTGLAYLLGQLIPDIPLHASTQMSGHNLEAAKNLHSLGFTRMVCAREMSFRDIKFLCENSPIEIEAFVHGALCVSRSGQCLMSSMIGGRSGNRGECAQPCRLPYNGGYPLSLKDACLAGHITDLISSGVASLKIEGRMKGPEYVYSVTKIYRRLLDERRNANADEIKRLENIFSRNGFTDGYFTDRIGSNMLGIRREKDKLATAAETKKSALTFKSTPSLSDSDISSELSAQNADKRRNAIEFSEKELQEKITAFSVSTSSAASNIRSARFLSPKQIPENAPDFFDVIYLPVEQFTPSLASGIVLPVAIHDSEKKALLAQLEKCKELGAVHCLIGNIGHISDVAKMGFVMHGDFRLNITNSLGFGFYNQLAKFEDIILSPELILAQARDIKQNKSVIVYGKLPLMTLERRCGSPKLVDRRNTSFSVIAENNISGMRQREIVYNGFTIWMADKADALKKAKINNSHFFFTNETQAECYDVIERYKNGLMPRDSVHIRRIK